MSDCFNKALTEKLPNLRRFALSLCKSADIADDLVQITVERALKARSSFDPSSRIEAWLFRILKNAWIDIVRKKRVRGTELDVDGAPELAGEAQHAGDARLMFVSVMEAVETLPLEQREVLLLVCVEELSYAEAADVLEVPKGTIMSRLSRARSALADRIGIK
ncbi:MAG: RNA polymerase sigma factor [Roseibium sp.]|uniref:RNA polymerase sigma factor n=1 Tax=Roseibium sp. TaxID=1936156 RepID=UPI002629E184|nr:RNA polymerase sigma factor [Roseibium sp.]MCV0425938.1 RNA polymerase sigma factor [Roseibium sp.]